VVCLTLYLATAVVATVVEVGILTVQMQAETARESDALAAAVGAPLARALWNYDEAQVELLLKTLAANPALSGVRVLAPDSPKEPGPRDARAYPLEYDQFGRKQSLGTLMLEPSVTATDRKIATAFTMAAVRTVVLVGLLSVILIAAVRRQVGGPLEALATQLSSLDPQGASDQLRVPATGLELTAVAESFNRLLVQYRSTIAALSTERAQLRALFDTLPDLVWLKDPAGAYLACNRRFEDFCGREESSLRGKTDFDMVDRDQAEAFRTHDLAALAAAKPTKNDEEVVFADGHHEYLETIKTPVFGADGTVIGVLGIGRDMTARRQAEVEKERLLQELRQSHKLESLGNLAGGLAHEMNNVLAVILGLASVQRQAAEPGTKAHQALDTMYRAADRGGRLVKSLLTFARRRPVDLCPIDLNALLNGEQALIDRVTASRVRLVFELEPGLPAVRGDPDALVSAILNLCGNSVDAMPEGGTLTVRTRTGPGTVELEIEDTGSGMAPEVLDRSRDPFFTTKPVGHGTGLGLPFVDSTVRSHGGTMDIRSEVGRGTTVVLRLPAVPACGPSQDLPPEDAQGAAHSLSVLLVDDDDLVRESTTELLEALGHLVTAVASGESALEALAAGDVPDLVVLDRNMPGLGGKETLVRLRRTFPDLPVLMASGQIDQTALDLAAQDSHLSLVGKPFSMDELGRKVAESVRLRESPPGGAQTD